MREILKGGKLGFRRTAGDVTLQGSHRRNDKSPGLLWCDAASLGSSSWDFEGS